MKKKKYTFEDFRRIVEALRAPGGCPWDRAQTHGSLERCMIEEAYEAVEGIRRYEASGDGENLCEELGDVLLQVVLHAQIAGEEGIFTLEDVVQGISEKMIRRHPHVFGTGHVGDARDVVKSWEEIKQEEKAGKRRPANVLEEIPAAFPALIRAVKVQKKLEKLDPDQTDPDPEETAALLKSLEEGKTSGELLEEQTGELLYRICDLARRQGVYPESALSGTVEKRIRRYGRCPEDQKSDTRRE